MKEFHEREKAATTIQTIFRGRRVRRMQADDKKQKAAVKIQVCLDERDCDYLKGLVFQLVSLIPDTCLLETNSSLQGPFMYANIHAHVVIKSQVLALFSTCTSTGRIGEQSSGLLMAEPLPTFKHWKPPKSRAHTGINRMREKLEMDAKGASGPLAACLSGLA